MPQASALLAQAERLNLNHPETLPNCREAARLGKASLLLLFPYIRDLPVKQPTRCSIF